MTTKNFLITLLLTGMSACSQISVYAQSAHPTLPDPKLTPGASSTGGTPGAMPCQPLAMGTAY